MTRGLLISIIAVIIVGVIIMMTAIMALQDRNFKKKRFVIRLKAYTIGNEDFTISLCEVKNQKKLRSFLYMRGYMLHEKVPYAIKVLHQVRHVQSIVEEIVSLLMIFDFYGGPIPTQEQIQQEIDRFVTNIEHFNDFMEQSKVVVVDDFDNIARELKEANQPILDNLAAMKNQVINVIREYYHSA